MRRDFFEILFPLINPFYLWDYRKMELILTLIQRPTESQLIALASAVLIPLSWIIRTKYNKDWQQILWSYFGILLLTFAVVMRWIIT